MPAISIEFDSTEYRNTVAGLIQKTRYKTLPDFLRWRMRIAVKDLSALTPPRTKKGTNVTESGEPNWAAQRRAGQNRIKYELIRLFPELQIPHVIKNPVHARAAKYVEKYIKERNLSALGKMLNDFGIPVPMVLVAAANDIHEGARGARGRVRPDVRYPILDVKTRDRLILEVQKRVGRLKHGWTAAIRHLQVKRIPQWITGHTTRAGGVMEDLFSDTPSIQVVNDAPSTKDMDPNEIVGTALRINANKMRTELRRIMEYELRKASRR